MKKLMLFLISGIIAILFGFFYFDNEAIAFYYPRSIFYFYSISSIFFIICIIKNIIFNENNIIDNQLILNKIKQFFGFHWLALFLSFLFILLSVFACRPDFRILPLETNILSTSQNLYERKLSYTTYSSIETETGKKTFFNVFICKNSAFFSYVLSLSHSLIGYRPENVFVLNSIIGFLSLFLMYYFIQLIYGRYWGICGLCVLAAFPVFILYTNSGSFDIFNLFCSLVLFLIIYCFIKQPNANKAELLLIWFIILTQSQIYFILSIIIIIPLIVYCLPQKEIPDLTYKTWISPLLLIPLFWSFKISSIVPILQTEGLKNGFDFKCFINNIIQSVDLLFSWEEDYGFIPIVSIIGILGFLSFVIKLFEKERINKNNLYCLSDKNYRIFWISIFAFYFLQIITIFSNESTDFTEFAESRHCIIFLPIIILMAIYILANFNKIFKKKNLFVLKKSYCFLAILFMIVIYWPNAGHNCGVRNLESYQYFRETRKYLDHYFHNRYDYILLVRNPHLFVPLKYSALSFEDFNKNKKYVIDNLRNRSFNHLVLIQSKEMNNSETSSELVLSEEFKEELLYEVQVVAGKLLCFSKIILND